MLFSRGTVVGALFVLTSLGVAHGIETVNSKHVSTTDTTPTCTSKPPNGTWVLEHKTPLNPSSPDLTRHARSVLYMNEVEENFYIGDGSGVYFLSHIADGFRGTQWLYHVALHFDLDSCMLSGTFFNLRGVPLYPDAVEYFYDGERFYGLFIFPNQPSDDSPLLTLFPQIGTHNASHVGDP